MSLIIFHLMAKRFSRLSFCKVTTVQFVQVHKDDGRNDFSFIGEFGPILKRRRTTDIFTHILFLCIGAVISCTKPYVSSPYIPLIV